MTHISARTIGIVIFFLGGLVALILAYIYLPHATITLKPASSERAVTRDITLTTAITEPDFKRFMLPAKVVVADFTESTIMNRAGGNAHDDFATGTVVLKNLQADEQPLLPKTHLRHEATGVMFLTDEAVRIPPQGEISVGITAKEIGSAGNVASGKFIVDKLPADLQSRIFAESSSATSGGKVFDTPLTESEINQSKTAAAQQALAGAKAKLTTQAGGAVIRDDLVTTTASDITSSVEPGSHATSFTVRASVNLRAFVVDEQDLLALTLLALRAMPTGDEEFLAFDPVSFKAELIKADFERGLASIRGQLTGTFAHKTEPSVFDTTKLAGQTMTETVAYLEEFSGVETATVTLKPFWVTTIPSRPGAVDIVVTTPNN